MGMRVTDSGIEWQRLDHDPAMAWAVSREVTAAARTSTIEAQYVTGDQVSQLGELSLCACGRNQERRHHYTDQLGREVCLTNAMVALREIESRWNNPFARVPGSAPKVDTFRVEGVAA